MTGEGVKPVETGVASSSIASSFEGEFAAVEREESARVHA